VDALRMQFRTVKVERDPRCPACGTRQLRDLVDHEQLCGAGPPARVEAVPTITAAALADRRRRGDPLDLVDVREQREWEIARIDGATLAPLSSLAAAMGSLDPSREVVVYCETGVRSARAVRQLQEAGFRRVWSLEGGIRRWSEEIDPSVPRY
jgi:adenylyltransferase/sulfurtransferase